MIEVKHLTKRYGNHVAVNDLNFTIDKGQVYGFLGPNGAGKSTTMNIITGCLTGTALRRNPCKPSGSLDTCRSSHPCTWT